jgi:hypothetical protein
MKCAPATVQFIVETSVMQKQSGEKYQRDLLCLISW